MGGMCLYISKMGKFIPDYLKDSWKYYLLPFDKADKNKM